MDANIVAEGVSSATSTPEDVVVDAVEESGAPKTDEASTDTTQEETAAAEVPAAEGDGASAPPTEEPFSFSFQYRHEDITVSKDEATELLQLGKHYKENLKATFDNLDFLAAIRGKDPKEYIEELVAATDSMYREELIEQLGADNPHIDELVELRKSKNLKNYEDIKKNRADKEEQAFLDAEKSTNTKLAEQFESIKQSFPQYENIKDIPESVFKAAVKSGDLEKEVLRFHFAEQKKVEKAKEKENTNKNQTTGTAKTNDVEDGITSAFLRGLWG
jgi:hypothetical protein